MSTTFSVTLINEAKGIHKTIAVQEDEIILYAANETGLDLPHSCCAGACFDCLGKLIEGKVEQTEKAISFLRPKEVEEGYVLLCAATPTSDCTIQTHYAEEVFD